MLCSVTFFKATMGKERISQIPILSYSRKYSHEFPRNTMHTIYLSEHRLKDGTLRNYI